MIDDDSGLTGQFARYPELLTDLKERIRSAQVRAALSVNRELVLLYWQIGKAILVRQEEEGWGAKVIARLSRDLSREFPEMRGFSTRNLKYMRGFAAAYPDCVFVQEVLAQITWYHNCAIIDTRDRSGGRELMKTPDDARICVRLDIRRWAWKMYQTIKTIGEIDERFTVN